MKIGFTGTRHGMTVRQLRRLDLVLVRLAEEGEITETHHGDCIGSDAQFHSTVRLYGHSPFIVAHPGHSARNPTDDSMRAFCQADEIRESKTHFARNRDIVNETDVIIATPPTKPMPDEGGTVYTVNFAKGKGKRVIIIYPDGEIE